MGKAQSIYFRDNKTLEEAEKKAKKMDRSLSYYIDELVKKDLKKKFNSIKDQEEFYNYLDGKETEDEPNN